MLSPPEKHELSVNSAARDVSLNFLFPIVTLMWNTVHERFATLYPCVILWLNITCSYIFQVRCRVCKCDERVKHL